MGLCSSNLTEDQKAEKDRNQKLSKEIDKARGDDQAINKLLLLGAGESGKSTLFKQMLQIYGKGFDQERKSYVNIVINNIFSAMKVLVSQLEHHAEIEVNPANVGYRNLVHEIGTDENKFDGEHAKAIKALWVDPAIQQVYERRAQFQLPDSAEYFFKRVDEVCQPNYLPTDQDILRSRVRTTGIVENAFIIDGNQFKMFDVGGQRNERKKWIHCFENVTAVLFVGAISEYDQVLFEDETTNRMVEALNLFEEICNSRWFRETSMILFLNKIDLFENKIKKVPITVCFPEYDGPMEVGPASEFIQNEFTSRQKDEKKPIYAKCTCATDTSNVSTVFNSVKDIIIRKSLGEAGLV